MAKQFHQGKYKPKNPQKYLGDPTNIFYRSGWECNVMLHLDRSEKVLKWSSEEIVIPYRWPDQSIHRYFVDFFVETADGKFLVEVKPAKYTEPPKQPKRLTKHYLKEVVEYTKNQAKWEAATKYAESKGWIFQVMTENNLKGII